MLCHALRAADSVVLEGVRTTTPIYYRIAGRNNINVW